MLTTSHLNSLIEEQDLSTYLVIPFDSVKNPDDFAQLRVLPDGTLYIINPETQEIQENLSLPALENKCIDGSKSCNLPTTSEASLTETQIPAISENNSDIQCNKQTTIADTPHIAAVPLEKKYKCIKCDNSFVTVKEYKNHLKWHKSQKQFKCNICKSGYNIENNLTIHNAMVHPTGSLKSCPICGLSLTYQRAASLKSHLMVHLVEELQSCDQCDAVIEKEEDYEQHMLLHVSKIKDDKSPLTCSQCNVKFKTKQHLKQHISNHTKVWKSFKKRKVKNIIKERKYHCEICNKSFIKQSLLERHERIHSGEKPFKCNICDQCFTQKGTLQIHLLRHTGKKPFACTLCPAKFNQKGNLRVHINKTHTAPNEGQKMFKCPHCSCIFKRIASLNGHVTKAHLKYRYSEDNLIGNVMKNLKDLEENGFNSYVTLMESSIEGVEKKFVVQMKKIGDVRWYKCSYCPKMCKKPSDLIRHIRVHTRERPFICKICRKSFSLKSTLISHMNTHNQGKNFKCRCCNSAFGSKNILKLHMRKHENEKLLKWQCTTCGILFEEFEKALQHKMAQEQPHAIQSVINKVMKQPLFQTVYGNLTFKPPRPKVPNTGNENSVLRPFHCTICDARFTKKINLIRHIKCHENDRRYKCHICLKAFITSYRLKEHINLHNNIKNYACKVCNKRFGTSTTLRRHMIVHNNQRPYVCPICSKHFQTLHLSRRHIKTVHKNSILTKIDTEIEALNTSNENNTTVLSQATSVIISNNKLPNEESNQLPTVEQIVTQESSQLLNSLSVQDQNTSLQTFYVNLENMQLIENSGIHLSSLVENEGNQENFQENTSESLVKDVNPVSIYTGSIQSVNALNVTTDAIFDDNTVPQTSAGLNEAKNIFDDASIICMNCNNVFTSFINFQKHNCVSITKDLNTEQTQDVIQDSNNEQRHSNKDKVIIEPNLKKKNVNKKLECPICEKSFRKRISYRNHMKTHSCLQCPHCKQVFSGKMAYFEHAATHYNAMVNDMYHCVFCLKNFKKPSDLKRHIRTHTGEKPFECKICDKKFSLKSTLKSHIQTHDLNNKQFGCDICNSFFTSKSSLKVHMTIHTGQMPYSCSTCNTQFRTLGAKKSHEKQGHRQMSKDKVKPSKTSLMDILKTLSSDIVMEKSKEDAIQVKTVPEYVPMETLSLMMTSNNVTQGQTLDLTSQIVNLDIPSEEILSTIPEDPTNLLQQLQITDMVLTTNENESVPSLVLDDVSFLDLNAVANNLQIISLPEADGRVTISIKENMEKPQAEAQLKPEKEKPKPVKCDICHKTYASKDGLRKHKKNVHGDKKKYGCKKCDEKFDNKEMLQNHEKEHCLCMLCASKKCSKNHGDSFHHPDKVSKEPTTSALLNLSLLLQ